MVDWVGDDGGRGTALFGAAKDGDAGRDPVEINPPSGEFER